ncbi:hypothetical protein CROQUDRAFT_714539 [Cronartium quercuum f. sp. fusiforme G11]|uniref:SH3 domain-containing protein n=1 Tax=Cronartium quercuum f. sp. fusiforme G11 TaxID=708437 RepID=A0A9P6TDJ2_9BASI|nr:hypothetical protein CROQUDRAFT_714539 [Cronartium quercuum f. sp. fusiforme G11]
MRIGNSLPTHLPQECRQAARIFNSFVNPSNGLDGLIPTHVLRSAHGFAIFTIVKAGFLMSVRAGTGLVIARLSSGNWSAPSAIGTGGMGFGGQAGAELTEFILVLNSKSAIRQFMSAGSITLGGNMSVALGPIGRNAEGSGSINTKGKLATMYSYSKTKGAFAGISVEGSAIFERQDCNVKSYGNTVTATKLLSGQIEPPDFAQELIQALILGAGGMTEYIDRSLNSFEEFDTLNTSNHHDDLNLTNTFDPIPNSGAYPFGSSTLPLSGGRGRLSRSTSSWKSEEKFNSSKRRLIPFNWRNKTGSDTTSQRSSKIYSWNQAPSSSAPQNLWEDENDPFHESDNLNINQNSIKSNDPSNSTSRHSFADLEPIIFGQIKQQITPIYERNGFDHSSTLPFQFDKLSLNSSPEINSFKSVNEKASTPLSGGIVDDLMSFDQIDASTHSHNDYIDYQTDSNHTTKRSITSNNDFQNNTNFGMETEQINNRTLSSSLNYNNDKLDRNLIDFDDQIKKEESIDYLVGTKMPSVFKTNTDSFNQLGKVIALYDFIGLEDGDLSFQKGQIINLIDKTDDQWWTGSIGLNKGLFPKNRVQNL